MFYKITAEHCSGGSVGHPCTKGIYSDPTDDFEVRVETDTQEDAEVLGAERLRDRVDTWGACDCQRKRLPGSNAWWASVAIIAEQIG